MSWQRIPRRYMRSTASVRVPVDGKWGGEYADEPRVIGHVRYENAAMLKRRDYVLSEGASGVLFVDAANSDGAFAIPQGSLVSIDGKPEKSADEVEELSIDGSVHHWEVTLK